MNSIINQRLVIGNLASNLVLANSCTVTSPLLSVAKRYLSTSKTSYSVNKTLKSTTSIKNTSSFINIIGQSSSARGGVIAPSTHNYLEKFNETNRVYRYYTSSSGSSSNGSVEKPNNLAKKSSDPSDEIISIKPIKETEKKDWKAKAKQVAQHYWLGTKMLGKNIGLAVQLIKRVIRGHTLTRRERGLLIQTSADVLRLVPFVFMVIVPFLELALPFLLRIFPNLLPSTYVWDHERREGHIKRSAGNVNVASHIKDFLEEVKVESKKDMAKSSEFFTFIDKVKSGETVSSDEILKFSKYFKDHVIMEKINRTQLLNMHRYLAGSNPLTMWYSNDYLKQQIYNKIDKIKKDDKLILKEGLDSLTVEELVDAAIVRGIKVEGHNRKFIEGQLNQWLDLSVNKNVPPSILILSRAFTLYPNQTPAQEAIEDTLGYMPPEAVAEVVKELPIDLSTDKGYEIAMEKLDDLTKSQTEIKAETLKEEEEIKEEEKKQAEAADTATATATATATEVTKESSPPASRGDLKTTQSVSDDDEVEIHKNNTDNNNKKDK